MGPTVPPPIYVGKVLSSARESTSRRTFWCGAARLRMYVLKTGAASSTKGLDIPTVVYKAVDVAADVVYLSPKP